LGPGVVEALSRYDWPGNVRELENVVERMLVLAQGPILSQHDLPRDIRAAAGLQDVATVARNAALDGGNNGPADIGNGYKTGEQMLVEDALRRFGGDKAKAARFIGWNRQKLYRKMKGFGIPADYGRTV
jgi:DNA-binding NtrC family response regulator